MISKFTIKYEVSGSTETYPIETMWDNCPTNIHGCYFLYNKDGDIIYIGKSINCIRQRLNTHCFQKPSVYLSENELLKSTLKRDSTKYFSYIKVDREYVNIVETYLINKFKPEFNHFELI